MDGFIISMIGLDKPDTGKYTKCLLVHIRCIAIGFIRFIISFKGVVYNKVVTVQ
jgi:preprotein translocase subunit Sss1